jgi:uncharacterized protein
LYTATVLKILEDAVGAPLARHFDLICGTSAGALLALGLAREIPADDLQAMFEVDGRRIFGSRGWWRRLLTNWVLAKHSADGLRAVLGERFGQTTIGDLAHRVLIPTVNFSSGRCQIFKTPHAKNLEFDHCVSLVDVGLATTAAPTYFPLHRIGDSGVFADGGLVANSPGLFGLHEAVHSLRIPSNQVRLLAIGTMTIGATIRGGATYDRGILPWGTSLFDLIISAQESAAHAMLGHTLSEHYYRIDDSATPQQSKDISALDRVSAAAIHVLKDRGTLAAKRSLGDVLFAPFRKHIAAPPLFFHGPNKNSEGISC